MFDNICLDSTMSPMLGKHIFGQFPTVELEIWDGSDETTLGKHGKHRKAETPKREEYVLVPRDYLHPLMWESSVFMRVACSARFPLSPRQG